MRAAGIVLLLMFAIVPAVHADAVDDAVKELQSGATKKDRLVAGVLLTRSGDARAIAALADALRHDRDRTVRRTAAVGLGNVVTATTSAADLKVAIAALDRASKKDKDAKVRKSAKKARAQLQPLLVPAGTYVDLGTMSSTHMRQTVEARVQTQPNLQTTTSGTGYHVDGTATFTHRSSKSITSVTCKVDLTLADYPNLTSLGSAAGAASIVGQAGATLGSLADQCVDAVVDDLLVKKIFPLMP